MDFYPDTVVPVINIYIYIYELDLGWVWSASVNISNSSVMWSRPELKSRQGLFRSDAIVALHPKTLRFDMIEDRVYN